MDIDSLTSQIRNLMASEVAELVQRRSREFKILYSKGNEDWFSELCFCILTANSSAKLGMRIQETLRAEGFLGLPEEELTKRLKDMGHRFSEMRAHFIVQARKFSRIRDIVLGIGDERRAREWLVENMMGLGYKEASHFLRNVGYDDLAILDRHVLRTMHEYGMIEEVPRGLTRRRYLELEARLQDLGKRLGLSLSKLDLYIWHMKTRMILK